MAPMRIQLAEDVIQEKQRVDPPALLNQLVPRQSKGKRQRALLPLRGLASSVSTLE